MPAVLQAMLGAAVVLFIKTLTASTTANAGGTASAVTATLPQ